MSKDSKRRPCPALGRDISPADCGEQRQSRLACPADCTHNPFGPANYSKLLEIEGRFNAKTMERLTKLVPDRAVLEKDLDRLERHGIHATHAYLAWKMFFATDPDQTTFAGRWEQSSGSELKNDEHILLRGKIQTRIALLEIHRVFADGRVEAVDLLSAQPAPLMLLDRSLAAKASRFTTCLAWIYPLPHFWRLSGTVQIIPEVAQLSAPEIVREIVQHLGGPPGEAEMRRWLAEHFTHVGASIAAVARLRRQQMLVGMDAKEGSAVYELRAPFARCREWLDAVPDVEPEKLAARERDEGFAEARVWLQPQPPTKQLTLPDRRILLGRVLLGQSHWRLEAFGAANLARLRQLFEQHFGERARFAGERVDDLGARLAAKDPSVDQSLAPPRLLENPDQFFVASSRIPSPPPGVSLQDAGHQLLLNADRAFLDEPVPALDNRTPRQAAGDPALRPKLLQLIQRRVRGHDENNLETGRTDDINWMLRDLGLTEIIFEPPPWRPPPPPEISATNTEPDLPGLFESTHFAEVDPDRPPAPALPDLPLSAEEASERLGKVMELFDTGGAAEREHDASGATLLDDVDELIQDLLDETEFALAATFVLQAWFALVPFGCRAPEINVVSLKKAFESNRRELAICAQSATPKKMEAFFQSGPQPGLSGVLIGGFLQLSNDRPKRLRLHPEAQVVILALIKAVVEELHEALRRK